jgi:Flp pilus assembly protein TadB
MLYAPPVLISIWFICSILLISKPRRTNTVRQKLNLAGYFGYGKVSSQAKEIGWDISTKEFLGIVLFAIIVGMIFAALFKNPLIIPAGLGAGFYLPRYLIQKYKKRQRMAMMIAIPDFGRILIARLIDHHSIIKAFEISQKDISGPMQVMVEEFVKDTGVGMGVQPALENLKKKAAFRKFNTFVETLLIAHQEGYSSEALKAMEKAVEAIENDVKAIETLPITTRKKKRELWYVVLASWAFPVLLSFMNSTNANIFFDTLYGKLLIFSFIICTLFVLIRGEEYLSLKLEEL